jgi:hypothetical protein
MTHKKNLTTTSLSASVQLIERRIYLIRGQKVMIDFDLAELYGVPTKRLNEQVTRNKKRFPEDFMFRLTKEFAISSSRHEADRHTNFVRQADWVQEAVLSLGTLTNHARSASTATTTVSE